jgi:hypothetical protein
MGEGRGKGKVVAVDIFRGRVTLSDKEGVTTTVTIEDFKQGRITDVGIEETQAAMDDYWGDIEGAGIETKLEERGRPDEGRDKKRKNVR